MYFYGHMDGNKTDPTLDILLSAGQKKKQFCGHLTFYQHGAEKINLKGLRSPEDDSLLSLVTHDLLFGPTIESKFG